MHAHILATALQMTKWPNHHQLPPNDPNNFIWSILLGLKIMLRSITLVDAVATMVPLAERARAVSSWECVVHTLSLAPCLPWSSFCSLRHTRFCQIQQVVKIRNVCIISYLQQQGSFLSGWIYHELIVYTRAYLEKGNMYTFLSVMYIKKCSNFTTPHEF